MTNLNKSEQLFIGRKIDSKLKEALSLAKPGDRRYFEEPNSEFLQVCCAGDERWIGKVVKGGVAVNDIDDIQRNVVSILKRVAPMIRTSVSALRIFVVEAEQVVVEKPASSGSGGGPYIDY